MDNSRNHEQLFLWNIISLCWLANDAQCARELASTIYEQVFNLPTEFEADVVDFWLNYDEHSVTQLALLVVNGYFLSIQQHIVLVALLVEKNLLTMNEAALLLKDLERSDIDKLHPKIQEVIHVTWLINEDAADEFMQPDEDNLLSNALQELLVFIRTS